MSIFNKLAAIALALLLLGGLVRADGITNPGGTLNAFSTISKSGLAASVTGTLTETPLATIVIPPNSIGANGQIRVNAYWTVTNSVNNKTLRVRLGAGGIGGSAEFTGVMTTVANVWSNTMIADVNATNSQFAISEAARGSDGLVTTGFNATSAIDMTASQSLVITGQLANTGETITLNSYSVEYAN